tara:strand:+ start:512 stop:763 length:252 start_codon:yes stop_codon:yes gene_type:complete
MSQPYWDEIKTKPSEKQRKEEEYITDIYCQAFVLGMGVRAPTKHGLLKSFTDFYWSNHDGMLPKTERELYDLIPDFIEYLGKI